MLKGTHVGMPLGSWVPFVAPCTLALLTDVYGD